MSRLNAPERRTLTARKVTMVAACYAGLASIVMLALLVRTVTPTPIAALLFVAAATALVGTLHPRTSAHRTLRH